MLYSPVKWQDFAIALHEAMNGNATKLKDLHVSPSLSALNDPATGMKGETDNVFGVPMGETNAQTPILCSDEEPVTKWQLEDFLNVAEDVSAGGACLISTLTPCSFASGASLATNGPRS